MQESNFDICQYELALGTHYHMRRQSFFEKWHRLTGTVSLIFSTSAVAAFVKQAELGAILAAVVAIAQCIDLIIDTRGKGRLHNDLRNQYLMLEAKYLCSGEVTDQERANFHQDLRSIEIQEPPVRQLLLELVLMDVSRKQQRKCIVPPINGFKEFTANMFDWKSQIATHEDEKAKEAKKKAKKTAKLKQKEQH